MTAAAPRGEAPMLTLQAIIGDHIGDDLTGLVLSPTQRARVRDYLLRHDLTT
jgi:hypothetical protein